MTHIKVTENVRVLHWSPVYCLHWGRPVVRDSTLDWE